MEIDGEIFNFIKTWVIVCASLCYCYVAGKIFPPGYRRLVSIFPVVCLFLYLPLSLTSIHLGGSTDFFIAWLANFKLLLFAFGDGPLASDPPLSLGKFIAVSCFPIKIQQNPPQISQNGKHPLPKSKSNGIGVENPLPKSKSARGIENPPPKSKSNGMEIENPLPKSKSNGRGIENPPPKSVYNYAIKALLVAVMVKLYDYSDLMHPNVVLFIYSWHVYFLLEIILALTNFLARNLFGIELQPQFNDPYYSTSLQDFWGRRWNLVVSSILQPSVYKPTVRLAAPVVGRKWAPLPAVLATFMVSALMHELIFYYLGRMRPTWEISLFFAIHGVSLMVEILLKKASPAKWLLPPVISMPLTIAYIFVTAIWLFFPQFVVLKIDVKAFEEYAALVDFLKNVTLSLVR